MLARLHTRLSAIRNQSSTDSMVSFFFEKLTPELRDKVYQFALVNPFLEDFAANEPTTSEHGESISSSVWQEHLCCLGAYADCLKCTKAGPHYMPSGPIWPCPRSGRCSGVSSFGPEESRSLPIRGDLEIPESPQMETCGRRSHQ